MEIKLGDRVKDKVTKLKGIVVGRAEYLYGCEWLLIIPEELFEGKPIEVWADKQRFKKLRPKETKKRSKQEFKPRGFNGGPMGSSPSRSFPKG